MDEFSYIFEKSGVDVICLSETWIPYNTNFNIFNLNGYNTFRADRLNHGGGVAMFIKSGIKSRFIAKSDPQSPIEYLFVELSSGNNKILCGSVSRPPRDANRRVIDMQPFLIFIEDLMLGYSNIILTGDFNWNVLNDDTLVSQMEGLGLSTPNKTIPTHYSQTNSTLLDLFFVSNLDKVLLYDQISVPAFSRHDLIFLAFDFSLNPTENTVSFRNFKNVDMNGLMAELSIIDWDTVFCLPGVEEQATFIEESIRYLFNKFVPIVTKTFKTNEKPW